MIYSFGASINIYRIYIPAAVATAAALAIELVAIRSLNDCCCFFGSLLSEFLLFLVVVVVVVVSSSIVAAYNRVWDVSVLDSVVVMNGNDDVLKFIDCCN